MDEAYRFEFYAAVRALERLYPERTPVGDGLDPAEEAVRFRTDKTPGFPASEVVEVQPADDRSPAEMVVAFMNLVEPTGPLPPPYAELLHQQEYAGETALGDFFDMLVHRLIALQYRSRKRHHVSLTTDAPDQSTMARHLRAIGGLGIDALCNRLSVPDHTLLRFAGLLNQSPPSAHGLSVLLNGHFDSTIQIDPLTGTWIDLEKHQQTHIGVTGQNQQLGINTVLGTRAWDQQAGMTIDVDAISLEAYLSFLPDGERHRALVDLAELYLGRTVSFDLSISLEADQVPRIPLSSILGPRLGESTWLGAAATTNLNLQVTPETFTPEEDILRIPLFADLNPRQLREVVDRCTFYRAQANEYVVRQGHAADALYVLTEGEAKVRYQSPEGESAVVLRSMEPGSLFGDTAMIRGYPYEESLVTSQPSRFLVLSRDTLDALIDRYPVVEYAVQEHYQTGARRRALPSMPSTGIGGLLTAPMWQQLLRGGEKETYDAHAVIGTKDAVRALYVLLDGGPIEAPNNRVLQQPAAPINLHAVASTHEPAEPYRMTQAATLLRISRVDLRRLCQTHLPIERALRVCHDRQMRSLSL